MGMSYPTLTLVSKIDIPTGSFKWLSDLDGNKVGLWKPTEV
jgi:hypothetical protein